MFIVNQQRKKYTPEYRREAANLVIESQRPIAQVKSWVVVYLFSNLGLVSWRWFRGHLGDKG